MVAVGAVSDGVERGRMERGYNKDGVVVYTVEDTSLLVGGGGVSDIVCISYSLKKIVK